jgi:hopene-associated glycosyltransferase HpnB
VSAALVAVATSAIWLYLLLGRGFFWRAAERDDALTVGSHKSRTDSWPAVTAIIPARNEAENVGKTIASLLRQTYPGRLDVVLVDDESTDGTAKAAGGAAAAARAGDRLTVLTGSGPPPGWTGKLFAMNLGFQHVDGETSPPEYVLFTDADISYEAPDAVERLVRGAETRSLMLTSLMVKLRCESFAERLLIPAFVFFFDKLYPFAWVNDPRRKIAAAAGGCMLVRRDALARAGGLGAIRDALIDDCALGALMKSQGPIWLGLTERVVSLRPYPDYNDIRRMVVRSAFAELRYSPWRLAGTLAGMGVIYLAPPLLVIFAHGFARWFGLAAWIAMTLSLQPMLDLYRRSPLWGVALPAIAAIYTAFTIESAIRHWRGRSGEWKGRFQAPVDGSAPRVPRPEGKISPGHERSGPSVGALRA